VYAEDVALLRCPRTRETLTLDRVDRRAEDGEVLEGVLRNESGSDYPIRNGIPRFVEDLAENRTWDYKWTSIDRGRGLNYRIIDRSDPAYEIHDIFDRNSHDGAAFQHARGRLALDVGCGVGQYSVKLLQEYEPLKVVSIDLTGGVDVFRAILSERYPELRPRVLIVQGDALALPFAGDTFDYVMSLGVLMHTGRTLEALAECARVLADDGQLNVWVYASEPVPFEAREPGRSGIRTPAAFLPLAVRYSIVAAWIRLFRALPHAASVRILRSFSSDWWYRANTARGLGCVASAVFPTVQHSDGEYRFINNYDGYVNAWSDTWNEHEVLPVLRRADCVPIALADWRLGVWAVKRRGFYAPFLAAATGTDPESRGVSPSNPR
jgi:SAM-dependent methyltransferase